MATLETRIKAFITSVGTDWKNIWAKIGSGTLNTTSQNLVGAINEVKATADAGTAAAASTTVAGVSERATDSEALAMSATDVTLSPSNLAAITNVNNGLLKLDSTGKVASAQLPSYVDDVLEYTNQAAFPGTGTAGIMYVALDTNKVYRWSGSAYVEISASPGTTDAVPEGSTNLYFTNTRADTRADSRITAQLGNPDADLAAYYTSAKA